jgi:putative ABC transport system permease protein
MLELFRTLSLRYIRQRWDRAALIVASIALGVATLVSTRILNDCIERATEEATTPLRGVADLYVSNGENNVPVELVQRVRTVPGVRLAQPIIVERVQLIDLDYRTTVVFGIDLGSVSQAESEQAASEFGVRVTVTNPLAALSGRGVLVGRDLADERARRLGESRHERLRVRVPAGEVELLQVGLIDVSEQGAAAQLGRNILVMEIAQAAKLLGHPGLANRIDILLEPGQDLPTVQAAIQQLLGQTAQVLTPERQGSSTREVVGGVKLGFTLCGIGALIVGLFLVYNALAVGVAERRHDIGIMRSVGATRQQIAGLFAGESVVMGLVGSLLGIPIGMFLAWLTLGQMREELRDAFYNADLASLINITPTTFLVAVVGGTLTSLLAALLPAMQAASEEAADAVRRTPSSSARYFRQAQALIAGTLLLGGLVLILLRKELPHRWGMYGGLVSMLLGLLLAIPLMVVFIAAAIRPIIRLLFGLEARLAMDNVLRAPARTGIVIAALAAGVALMVQIAGVGLSNERPIIDWIERAITAELFVMCGSPANATASNLPIEPEIGEKLRAISGVEAVMPIRYRRLDYADFMVMMIALDAQTYRQTSRNPSALPQLPYFDKLRGQDTVLISDNFSNRHRIRVGDQLTFQGPRGPVTLTVAGVIQEYSWSRGSLVIDRQTYIRLFDDRLVDVFHVFVSPQADLARTREATVAFAREQSLLVIDRAELRSLIRDFLDRVYKLAYLQQVVVGIVASLGVVMALLISVLQRQRELGLLRAVGATQGQVLRSVLAEAAIIGFLGTLLGILAGLPMEWYVLRVVIFEESGFSFPMTIPWREALGIGAISISVAVVAGLVPAIQAGRLRITNAIAYE